MRKNVLNLSETLTQKTLAVNIRLNWLTDIKEHNNCKNTLRLLYMYIRTKIKHTM